MKFVLGLKSKLMEIPLFAKVFWPTNIFCINAQTQRCYFLPLKMSAILDGNHRQNYTKWLPWLNCSTWRLSTKNEHLLSLHGSIVNRTMLLPILDDQRWQWLTKGALHAIRTLSCPCFLMLGSIWPTVGSFSPCIGSITCNFQRVTKVKFFAPWCFFHLWCFLIILLQSYDCKLVLMVWTIDDPFSWALNSSFKIEIKIIDVILYLCILWRLQMVTGE